MMGDFGFGHMGYSWIFWLVLVFGGFFLFRWGISNNRRNPNGIQESPIEILKQRYARGEISKNEFERMKKDLIG